MIININFNIKLYYITYYYYYYYYYYEHAIEFKL